jgi:hypothetical protein
LTASSIFGGAKASQEADNILIIQRMTLQSLKVKTSLQVRECLINIYLFQIIDFLSN